MKICDVVQFYSPLSGGVKRYIHDKMAFFANRADVEHIVMVPSHRNALTTEYQSRIYEILSSPLPGSISYRLLLAPRRISEILRKERPDVVEVGDPYFSAWTTANAARRMGIPVLAFYHSDYPRALDRTVRRFLGPGAAALAARFIRVYLRRLYRKMDLTVVSTLRMKLILESMAIPNLELVPLGTDTRVFHPVDSRGKILAELRLPPATRLLLYAGRLAREKNVSALPDMVQALRSADLPLHLLVVGDGEQRRLLATAARDHPDITYLPYCHDAGRLVELYSAADLFVHPGATETFGLVSLEAQACGTPVLAVRNGGVDETLAGENPLILADRPDGPALAEAALALLRIPQGSAQRLTRHRRICERFSNACTCEHLLGLYRRLSEARTHVAVGSSVYA